MKLVLYLLKPQRDAHLENAPPRPHLARLRAVNQSRRVCTRKHWSTESLATSRPMRGACRGQRRGEGCWERKGEGVIWMVDRKGIGSLVLF